MNRRLALLGLASALLAPVDTNISSCGPVCTKTVGAACGPNSETCGGP